MEAIVNNERVKKGRDFLEQIWWRLAKQIIQKAGILYNWKDEDYRTAGELYLRPNDYKVIVTLP
jgi:hypothetical protein